MKSLLLTILLFSNTLWASSLEVVAFHLNDGNVVSATNETDDILIEDIAAIEVQEENKVRTLVSPRLFKKLLKAGISVRAVRSGGDGSGGG